MTAAEDLLHGFSEPPPVARPMMRWWWFGPELDHDDIVPQLTAMAEAGLGGVEVAYVYPLGPVEHPFLSSGFLDSLRFAAQTATSLGLRFDLTLGSGWSFGGPHVTLDTASRRLVWDVREIGAEAVELRVGPRWPGEEFVAGYVGEGTLHEMPTGFERLVAHDGLVHVAPGGSHRLVALAWSAPTGQQVKRPAAGAEGPVLDHYSAEATRAHLRAVADPLLDAVGAEHVGSVFCDSLEAYLADWTPRAGQEFAARRGSDLIDDLWMLRFDAPGSERLRAAYYETLSDLFEENFLSVIREWAAARGVPFRVQNYGVPLTRLSASRSVDVIEGEGWGWRGVPQTRWAASAAHWLKRPIVSAEAWTWVHSPSLRATPLDLKGEAHEHFLLGVNHLIGHGWPASPAGAAGMGRLFYASGALDDRNAWWPAMPALARYLTRLCWLLRQGEPVAEVLLYLPSADAYDVLGTAQGGLLDLWRSARAIIGDAIPAAIRDAGLDFDLVDDRMLASLDPVAIAARGPVVLPHVTRLPDAVRDLLRAVEAAGGAVLHVPGSTPLGGAVGRSVNEGELEDELRASVGADLSIETVEGTGREDIGFVHRRVDDLDVYLVVNTGAETRRLTVTPRTVRAGWQRWRAEAGAAVESGSGPDVALTLSPYEAVVIVAGDDLPTAAEHGDPSPGSTMASASLEGGEHGGWSVAFGEEEPVAVALPHDWAQERPHYSGVASYLLTFEAQAFWGAEPPRRVELDFGQTTPAPRGEAAEQGMRGASYRASACTPVREIAAVEVNGVDCGTVFAPPYRADITQAIRPGENTLRIRVANVSAAALAAPDAQRALEEAVGESHRRYGVRFRMQDVGHAADGLSSGLLAVPSLRWAASPAGSDA